MLARFSSATRRAICALLVAAVCACVTAVDTQALGVTVEARWLPSDDSSVDSYAFLQCSDTEASCQADILVYPAPFTKWSIVAAFSTNVSCPADPTTISIANPCKNRAPLVVNASPTPLFFMQGQSSGLVVTAPSNALHFGESLVTTTTLPTPTTTTTSSTISPSSTTSTTLWQAPAVPFKVDIGGPGNLQFLADPGICDGEQFTSALVSLAPVFASEKFGNPLNCSLRMSNGTFLLTLDMVELYYGPGCNSPNGGAGTRMFDAFVNGVQVISSLDLFAQTGGCGRLYQFTTPIAVTGGILGITMPASRNNAELVAIELALMPLPSTTTSTTLKVTTTTSSTTSTLKVTTTTTSTTTSSTTTSSTTTSSTLKPTTTTTTSTTTTTKPKPPPKFLGVQPTTALKRQWLRIMGPAVLGPVAFQSTGKGVAVASRR